MGTIGTADVIARTPATNLLHTATQNQTGGDNFNLADCTASESDPAANVAALRQELAPVSTENTAAAQQQWGVKGTPCNNSSLFCTLAFNRYLAAHLRGGPE